MDGTNLISWRVLEIDSYRTIVASVNKLLLLERMIS
jgi:hypothetical protein